MHIVIFLVVVGCLLYTFGVQKVTYFALACAAFAVAGVAVLAMIMLAQRHM